VTSSTSTPAPVTTSAGPITVPTPIAQTCPTPGTYTFPATTVVVTETTTVCGASSTQLPSGTHTIGGVTTVVETSTTVVCPYATTSTQPNGVVTSVIKTTTYVCPSAGTYTIAPITTTVPSVTTVVVPVVTTYCPGTYTAPAVVTTVTETDIVVYCPFTSSEAALPTSTAAAVATSSAAPAPAKASSAATSLGSNEGDLWAMTYTPYDSNGHCKSASDVLSDIADIAKAGFKTLRVYSTDCDTLPNVGAAARAHGLRMIIGIFIGEVGCDNASPDVADQIAAIKEWKQWDLVDLCVVANEALANGFCSVSQLTSLITHVKTELASVGYTGPFTTTDVVSSWLDLEIQSICEVIDVVGTNAHAYFNSQTLPEAAGLFVAGQLALVEAVCKKSGVVLETGWPSQGECNGVACPGEAQQRTAIQSIQKVLGHKVAFFSFKDDAWKDDGKCLCEKHWGCSSVFGL
jgi:exo-beta-1,3-glucanase (GH17 family)